MTNSQKAAIEEAAKDHAYRCEPDNINPPKWADHYHSFKGGMQEAINNPERYDMVPLSDFEDEYWLPVPNYEGMYEASNLGRIKSVPRLIVRSNGYTQRRRGIIKKQPLDKDGYRLVTLLSKTFRVHKIIAQTFKPNSDDDMQINHKDGNKSNNRVDNLEWVSCKENVNHFHKVLGGKPVPVKRDKKKSNSKPVINLDTGEVYDSMSNAAKALDVSVQTITDRVHNRYDSSYKIKHNISLFNHEQ